MSFLCRRNASVSHLSDFDAYKEYASLIVAFKGKTETIQMVDRPSTTPILVKIGKLWLSKLCFIQMYLFTRKSVDCFAWCICHCSAWFRQDHGFDPPRGSHQLPVYLKYSVRLKLLAQLVHICILLLWTNFSWCVASWGIKNALFLLAITASQWRNVLFDPNVFEARPRYFVFLWRRIF